MIKGKDGKGLEVVFSTTPKMIKANQDVTYDLKFQDQGINVENVSIRLLGHNMKMKGELFYLKNWNLWIDIVIFVKTIGIIIKGKNF